MTNGGAPNSGSFFDVEKLGNAFRNDELLRTISQFQGSGEVKDRYFAGNGCSYNTHRPGGAYDEYLGITRDGKDYANINISSHR